MSKTVRVELGLRSYDVHIAAGAIETLGPAAAGIDNVRAAVVIADSTVAKLYGRRAVDSLRSAHLDADIIDFPPGEQNKTLATAGRIFDKLFAIKPEVDRNSLIVALGGGVTGDMAGLIAATALRGLRWLQCATTLLGAVDASVGGKTGVDHPAGKNLIGAFHQPSAVIIDVETLKTLTGDELANGLAECVKHGVIRDASLLDFIEQKAAALLECDAEAMTELIARNVSIKAIIVAADERETGQRAHLNFGHTIGHAIEVHVGYERIAHGQAVALGMTAADHMAVARGLIGPNDAERVHRLLGRLGLPTKWEALDGEKIWRIMQHDKKARGGKVRMVLPTRLGSVDIFDDIEPQAVRDAVKSISK